MTAEITTEMGEGIKIDWKTNCSEEACVEVEVIVKCIDFILICSLAKLEMAKMVKSLVQYPFNFWWDVSWMG